MSYRAVYDSRIGRVRAFYFNNPDEELTLDDMAVKFNCTHNQAEDVVRYLRRVSFLVSDGHRPAVYRRNGQ